MIKKCFCYYFNVFVIKRLIFILTFKLLSHFFFIYQGLILNFDLIIKLILHYKLQSQNNIRTYTFY